MPSPARPAILRCSVVRWWRRGGNNKETLELVIVWFLEETFTAAQGDTRNSLASGQHCMNPVSFVSTIMHYLWLSLYVDQVLLLPLCSLPSFFVQYTHGCLQQHQSFIQHHTQRFKADIRTNPTPYSNLKCAIWINGYLLYYNQTWNISKQI